MWKFMQPALVGGYGYCKLHGNLDKRTDSKWVVHMAKG